MSDPRAMTLCPPEPGRCPECATRHDPDWPHNRDSPYYLIAFHRQHGRAPSWKDAIAHCPERIRTVWEEELKRAGAWTRVKGEGPMNQERLQLTENEALVTLASVIEGSVKYAGQIVKETEKGKEPDQEDWESLFELQSVAKKLQRLLKMPDPTFFQFCAAAAGTPDPAILETMIEAQKRIGGRQ